MSADEWPASASTWIVDSVFKLGGVLDARAQLPSYAPTAPRSDLSLTGNPARPNLGGASNLWQTNYGKCSTVVRHSYVASYDPALHSIVDAIEGNVMSSMHLGFENARGRRPG